MIVKIQKKRFEDYTAKGFSVKIRGRVVKGFVVKKNDLFFAYLNVCKHLPITLDLNDDNFFTFDKAFLQCHMHGAMYEIETGYCVGGPCLGARLDALSLAETEDELIITVPDSAANPK